MSSHHQILPAQFEATVPFNLERMVNFIDRFTARIVEKLQGWERDRAGSETSDAATTS